MCALKIGLFGGSFDPIHQGHTRLAEAIFKSLALDELYWIPAFQSLNNKSLQVCAEHRLKMCAIIANKHPGFKISDFETNKKRAVYTIETIEYFHQKFPNAKLYWIMGADQAINLHAWNNAEAILKLATIIVYPREHTDMPHELNIAGNAYPAISDSKYFEQASIIYLQQQPYFKSASSEIKSSSFNKDNYLKHLDPDILAYIKLNHLYQE